MCDLSSHRRVLVQARRDATSKDEPFAFDSREFLRKKLIGRGNASAVGWLKAPPGSTTRSKSLSRRPRRFLSTFKRWFSTGSLLCTPAHRAAGAVPNRVQRRTDLPRVRPGVHGGDGGGAMLNPAGRLKATPWFQSDPWFQSVFKVRVFKPGASQ